MTQLLTLGLLFQFYSQLALKFHYVKMCFGITHILSFFQLFQHYICLLLCLSHLVTLQLRKLTRSLTHWQTKIAAKYEQLDSGEFGAVGTPAFNAKSADLASLFAHMNQLCQRLNLSIPTQLHRLLFFKY